MTTYIIYLNARPIAWVDDTNSAYACFEASKTIAEMTSGNASLVWGDTGEVVASIDFTKDSEDETPIWGVECRVTNCGYYYKDDDDEYARCHCLDDGTLAPCEYEDDYYEDDDCDYDVGYDPYCGCYTDDC